MRDAAHDLVGDRGRDDGDPPRPRRTPGARRSSSSPAPTTATPTGCSPQAGSGLATQGIPASPGVPAGGRGRHVVVPWNDAQALARRPPCTTSPRSSPSRARPTWASSRPAPGFLELLRERADASGALLILDEVISGLPRRARRRSERTGVTRRPRRPRQDPRRRPARRPRSAGRARAARAARARPARSTRRARCRATRSRSPPASRRSRCSTTPPTRALDATHASASPTGLRAGARGERAGQRRVGARPADRLLRGSPPRDLADAAGAATCDAYAAWCRELLGARRLPAAVAVRGVVSLARPRRRADRAHARRGGRRLRGDATELAAAAA